MLLPHSPIESLVQGRSKILPALKRLGIHTIEDLLFHAPNRYDDFSNIKKIREITPEEVVTIQGVVEKISRIF